MSRSSKRPTQHDVAQLAGVSRGTVSLVVNGLADGKVAISPETRARVWAAIEELGYVPNAGARALRSGSTKTIGLIIPDLHNPHFWENADGVEQEARAAGYRVLLSSMDLNAQYGEDIFKDLSGRRIDGLIVMGLAVDQSPEAMATLTHNLSRNLPVVEVNDSTRVNSLVDRVVSDYRSATEEAMNLLFTLGHRRIGFINGVAIPDLARDRLEPYQAALWSQQIPVEQALILNSGPTFEDGYQAALRLFDVDERPTAIVAINDILALGVLRAASDRGLQVPQDLSVIGYDNIPAAKYLVPRLTTASKDPVRMGREAVRLALSRIENPGQPCRVVTIPTQLVVRESTGPVSAARSQ